MKAKAAEVQAINDKTLFAFRADTSGNAWSFLVRLYETGMFWVKELRLSHSGHQGLPDCNVELRILKVNPKFNHESAVDQPYHIPPTLAELRRAAGDVVDCDHIVESLDYAERFTGDRYYTPWMMDEKKFPNPTREVKSFVAW